MQQNRIYDREFKETAVQLSMQRANLGLLANELGISKKLLYSWRSQYRDKGKESFPGRGNTAVSAEAKAEEALRNNIKRLELENEILKKALGHDLQERLLIYVFIQDPEHKYTVEMMCCVLQLSRSSITTGRSIL